MWRYLFLSFICFSLVGCKTFPFKIVKANKEVTAVAKEIEKKDDKILNKGKAFVFGAKYANEQETNRSPSIEISHNFLDLATLTIGNADIKDAALMKEITDGLLAKYAKTAEQAEDARLDAELKLQKYIGEVDKLQKDKEKLTKEYEQKTAKLEEINQSNAFKAGEYDKENGFWAQFNIFSDIGKLFKKLFVIGITLTVVVIGFNLLETFFPAVRIFSFIFGGLGRLAMKLSPAVKRFAGVVSENVMKSLKVTVKGLQNSFDKLKNHPIEQELIQGYPEDHIFTKKEVLSILEEFSLKIESLIKKELEITNDAETRAIVSEVKNEIKTGQISV